MTELLPDSKVLEILRRYAAEAEKPAVSEEEKKEYIRCLNYIASTPEGANVLKCLAMYCRIYSVDNHVDTARMAVEKGRRDVYLVQIRPYLYPEHRGVIENF